MPTTIGTLNIAGHTKGHLVGNYDILDGHGTGQAIVTFSFNFTPPPQFRGISCYLQVKGLIIDLDSGLTNITTNDVKTYAVSLNLPQPNSVSWVEKNYSTVGTPKVFTGRNTVIGYYNSQGDVVQAPRILVNMPDGQTELTVSITPTNGEFFTVSTTDTDYLGGFVSILAELIPLDMI